MAAARRIPGAIWDEGRQMWRLPKRKGAERDVAAAGLADCLLDPAITVPPRYGWAKGSRKVPHPLARMEAAWRASRSNGAETTVTPSRFAKQATTQLAESGRVEGPDDQTVIHPTVADDYYETAPERLHADGTVKQTVPDTRITPYLDAYVEKLRAAGRAEATVRTYRSAVKGYAEWLPVELPEATPGMLRAYLDYLVDVRCLKERTVRGVVQAVGVI